MSYRDKERHSVIEAVNLACSRVVLHHGWVSEFSLFMHEHDIDVSVLGRLVG